MTVGSGDSGSASHAGLRVVHVVAGELDGGAARGALWLHQALRRRGLFSTLVSNGSGVPGDTSVQPAVVGLLPRLRQSLGSRRAEWVLRAYPRRSGQLFNSGRDGYGVAHLSVFREADLVHLHWFNGLLSLPQLAAIDRPTVWTLRDMWPFTGGCHYAMGCERYCQGCGACPQLGSQDIRDLSHRVFHTKRASLPPRLTPVGISRWISDCASASGVFGALPVETIPNGVDTRRFAPAPVAEARAALGLPADGRIVMFSAQHVGDAYKGFGHLRQALAQGPREGLHLLVVGRADAAALDGLQTPFTALGFVTDDERLRQAYAAADVFVGPSLMEAFGKSLAEALACGTPVVCFDATGPRDIVDHRSTGYRAEPFEPADLARGLQWVLDLPAAEHAAMRLRCREQALIHFDIDVIAGRYEALYRRVLASAV